MSELTYSDAMECIARLEKELAAANDTVANQRRQLSTLNEIARKRNRELDALRIVWCSGGCEGGMARYGGDVPTNHLVLTAMINTERMFRWHVTHHGRELANTRHGEAVLAAFRKVKEEIGALAVEELARLSAEKLHD